LLPQCRAAQVSPPLYNLLELFSIFLTLTVATTGARFFCCCFLPPPPRVLYHLIHPPPPVPAATFSARAAVPNLYASLLDWLPGCFVKPPTWFCGRGQLRCNLMPVDAGSPRVQHAGAGGRQAAPRPGSRFAGRAMCVCMHLTSIGVRGHRNQKSRACPSPAHFSTPRWRLLPRSQAFDHAAERRRAVWGAQTGQHGTSTAHTARGGHREQREVRNMAVVEDKAGVGPVGRCDGRCRLSPGACTTALQGAPSGAVHHHRCLHQAE
jgi:hypothetical protein